MSNPSFQDILSLCAQLKFNRSINAWEPLESARDSEYYMDIEDGVQVDEVGDGFYEAYVMCDLKHDGLEAGDLNALVFSYSAEGLDATLADPTISNVHTILTKELANVGRSKVIMGVVTARATDTKAVVEVGEGKEVP